MCQIMRCWTHQKLKAWFQLIKQTVAIPVDWDLRLTMLESGWGIDMMCHFKIFCTWKISRGCVIFKFCQVSMHFMLPMESTAVWSFCQLWNRLNKVESMGNFLCAWKSQWQYDSSYQIILSEFGLGCLHCLWGAVAGNSQFLPCDIHVYKLYDAFSFLVRFF